jgi:hypothetical protein
MAAANIWLTHLSCGRYVKGSKNSLFIGRLGTGPGLPQEPGLAPKRPMNNSGSCFRKGSDPLLNRSR